jgi:hypothetical protein
MQPRPLPGVNAKSLCYAPLLMARGLVLSNDVSSHPCTIPRVKRRNLDRWIVLAVFGAQLFAPFAACAAVKPDVSLSDLQGFRKTPLPVLCPGLPVQTPGSSWLDHCTHCPGGSAPAAPTLRSSNTNRGIRVALSQRGQRHHCPFYYPLPRTTCHRLIQPPPLANQQRSRRGY